MDNDNGRRNGSRADFQALTRLSQAYNCIHTIAGYPVEPLDLHPSVRHLHCTYDMLSLSDKVVHGYSLGKERIEDVMEMIRIAGGLSHEEFDAAPRMFTNINSTSPLKHDYPMLDPGHASGPSWPACCGHAFYFVRCDGPGHHCRCDHTAKCRSPGRNCVAANH